MAAQAMRQSAAPKPRASASKFFMSIPLSCVRSAPPRPHAAATVHLPWLRRRAALVVLVAAVARRGITVQLARSLSSTGAASAVPRDPALESRCVGPVAHVARLEASRAAIARAVACRAVVRGRAELVAGEIPVAGTRSIQAAAAGALAIARPVRHVDVGPAAIPCLLPAVVGLAVNVAVVAGIDVAAPALGDRGAIAEAAGGWISRCRRRILRPW